MDCAALRDRLLERAEESAFALMERLAGELAEVCLATPDVSAVRLSVAKPAALRHARTVEVELFRRRG